MTVSKKQNLVKKIQKNDSIQDRDKELLTNDFLREIKRTGAKKPGTQANYLQAANLILEKTDIKLHKIDQKTDTDLETVCEKVSDKIQDSQLRHTEGETSQRMKRHQWTTWKKMLETVGIKTGKHKDYIPKVKFTTNKGKVNKRCDTDPEDLPTPNEMREYIKTLKQVSGETVKLRNQALVMLLWDKGPRIGEALSIKMKHVSVNQKNVKIEIPGNKKSKDRKVLIVQGREVIKDYISSHPAKDQKEAYLFGKLKTKEYFEPLSKKPLRRKVHQARSKSEVDFKTQGEPFHIFRKGMVTAHIVNGWATWEEICELQGKKTSNTKPDYLKMALSDVNENVAGNVDPRMDIELDDDQHRMAGKPLVPTQCRSCSSLNRSLHDVCKYCGTTLPENDLPQTEEDTNQEDISAIKKMAERFDMTQKEFVETVLEAEGN